MDIDGCHLREGALSHRKVRGLYAVNDDVMIYLNNVMETDDNDSS